MVVEGKEDMYDSVFKGLRQLANSGLPSGWSLEQFTHEEDHDQIDMYVHQQALIHLHAKISSSDFNRNITRLDTHVLVDYVIDQNKVDTYVAKINRYVRVVQRKPAVEEEEVEEQEEQQQLAAGDDIIDADAHVQEELDEEVEEEVDEAVVTGEAGIDDEEHQAGEEFDEWASESDTDDDFDANEIMEDVELEPLVMDEEEEEEEEEGILQEHVEEQDEAEKTLRFALAEFYAKPEVHHNGWGAVYGTKLYNLEITKKHMEGKGHVLNEDQMVQIAKRLQDKTIKETEAVLLEYIKAKTVMFHDTEPKKDRDPSLDCYNRVFFVDYHHSSM